MKKTNEKLLIEFREVSKPLWTGEQRKVILDRTSFRIVSHQASTLEKLCKSAAVLRHGQLHMFDTLEEAKALYDYETENA